MKCRMDVHCKNAQAVAEFLSTHPRVKSTHYPGLVSHPDHLVAKNQMKAFGGMLAMDVDGTIAQAKKVAE
ncbi:PLP-dependent transferase, partial [Acinetobacter baumannii]